MARRNQSLGWIALAASVFGAAALWSWSTSGGASPTGRAAVSAAESAGAGATETERMRTDLARMQANLARAERRIAELETNQPTTGDDPTAVPPAGDPTAAPETAPSAEPSEGAQQALAATTFDSEPDDPSWNVEREMEQLIASALPRGSSLQSLTCRSTLCRVETNHPDQVAQQTFVNAIGGPRPGEPRPFSGALFDQGAASGDGRTLRSVTYLVRRGHDAPRPE